eukprot:16177041-Heterocapsa_arctica.AAC.1
MDEYVFYVNVGEGMGAVMKGLAVSNGMVDLCGRRDASAQPAFKAIGFCRLTVDLCGQRDA